MMFGSHPSRGLVLLAALAVSTSLTASPKEKSSNAEVKFTARAELVLVPAIVTDKAGNHITGLKKEDFSVFENGIEQKIATFEEIASDPHRLRRPTNPNEFTNSLTGETSTRRITLMVLDLVNTRFTDQAYARQDLLKYLTQSVDQREPTALFTLTRTGLHVIHDFTTDPRVLIAALHKLRGDPYEMVDSPEEVEAITGAASPDGSAGTTAISSVPTTGRGANGAEQSVQREVQQLQTMLEDSELNFQSFEQRIAITYTLDAMQEVAQAMAGFPGRKSLIWASGGFPFNVSDNTMQLAPAGRDTLADVLPLYEHTWQLLNDAQISLYPVDVKGLQVTAMANASIRNPGKNFSRNMNWRQLDTQGTLETFAAMTGGRAYFNSNDLVRGYRDAVNDSAEYYMLGYYLDRSNTQSGWRKLAVKSKREHTEVRARSGFFISKATVDPEDSRTLDINSALRSPLDYTSLPFVARWGKIELGKEAGNKAVNYELHLQIDSTLVDDADNNHIALEILALTRSIDGKTVNPPVGQKVDLHLTPERLAAMRQKGLIYTNALNLPAGDYTVRFVVRNDLNGRIGSVAAPLKVE
jgi:VWFA-related protein